MPPDTPNADDPKRALMDVMASQSLAVLATSGTEGPYASLVAVAPSPDAREILFATTRATRKHANLAKERRVALLIDTRTNRIEDFRDAAAATAIGVAREVPPEERPAATGAYLARHPHLVGFAGSPTTALYRVEVERWILVRRFQNVVEVDPRAGSPASR